MDITNFIAPGSNYAGYLKAFGEVEPKEFFPYQWVESLDKLKCESLPPQEAFKKGHKGLMEGGKWRKRKAKEKE